MRHSHLVLGGMPAVVTVPRPLRNLLAASDYGLLAGCRRAWHAAAAAPGEWVAVNPTEFVAPPACAFMSALRLRAIGVRLDLHMSFGDRGHAVATGRRVIVVAQSLPLAMAAAAVGRSLPELVDAPFLDASIRIMRIIHRPDEAMVDVRCRCPSHRVALAKSDVEARD